MARLGTSLYQPHCAAQAVASLGGVEQGASCRHLSRGPSQGRSGFGPERAWERCWGIGVLGGQGARTARCITLSSPGLLSLGDGNLQLQLQLHGDDRDRGSGALSAVRMSAKLFSLEQME